MNKLDLWGGIFLSGLGLALIFFIIPYGTEKGMYYGLSPTVFPTFLASGLTFCAVALTVQAANRLRAGQGDEASPIRGWNLAMFALSISVILAGVFAIDLFGMVIAAPILIAALMLLLAERHPLRILATATIPVGLIYYLALHVLKTPVP